MKRYFFIVVLGAIWSANCWAVSIGDLLDGAARQPGYAVSGLSVRENSLQKERATAALFPKLGLFGRFESYNSPTNLRPMPPIQAGDSIPFSREILRYGLSFDAPVYVRELYVLQQKAALESVRVRFRPVFMTAFGIIAGMIPIAFEWAVGLERLSPLADVAVGGLLMGTVLTLIYIPMFAYSVGRKK